MVYPHCKNEFYVMYEKKLAKYLDNENWLLNLS